MSDSPLPQSFRPKWRWFFLGLLVTFLISLIRYFSDLNQASENQVSLKSSLPEVSLSPEPIKSASFEGVRLSLLGEAPTSTDLSPGDFAEEVTLIAPQSSTVETQEITAGAPRTAGPLKIGLVDMEKVYREFHRTVEGEAELNADKAAAKQEVDVLLETFNVQKSALEERQKKDANAINSAEVTALQKLRKEIEDLTESRKGAIEKKLKTMRTRILEELTTAVREISKGKGFDLVFDSSGKSANGTEILVLSKTAVNFTNEVLKKFNP